MDSPIQPLKTDPKYGYFPTWPEDGNDWVHPEDVALARQLIPSNRVFCRDGKSGDYGILYYGNVRLRTKPALWNEVRYEGFDLGNRVEVRSRGLQNEPRIGVIREVCFDEQSGELRYWISDNGKPIETAFAALDLKHVEEPDGRMEVRIESEVRSDAPELME